MIDPEGNKVEPVGTAGEHMIETAANIVVALVALLHARFLALEMFLEKPAGLRTFRLTPSASATTKVLAANQACNNGFPVAGLLWVAVAGADDHGVRAFFLGCVVVAGVFGAATVRAASCTCRSCPRWSGWGCCSRADTATAAAKPTALVDVARPACVLRRQ